MQLSRLRLSTATLALGSLAALLLAACNGGSNSALDAVPTAVATSADGAPIPTATPYARVPEPTIVSGPTAGAPSTSQVNYLVEAGDTLSAIAERFDTTVEDIMAANTISDATLIFVGQSLVIPSGSAIAASAPPPPADDGDDTASADATAGDEDDSSDDGGPQTYEVQPGDTALAIAFRFDVTIDALAAANGTTFDGLNNLQVGDLLVIP
jgi:LysM repeat protein